MTISKRLLRAVLWSWCLALVVKSAPIRDDECNDRNGECFPPTPVLLGLGYNELNRSLEDKYFHEAVGHELGDDDRLGHYDVRFFHGMVSEEERAESLHHMMIAYLDFFRKNNLETWIAHGTLLGWWWNSQVCAARICVTE